MRVYQSWGRYPQKPQSPIVLKQKSLSDAADTATVLAFGNGRSYGDSCLNSEGRLLDTYLLDQFISFDDVTGLLRVESGVLLSDILDVVVPRNWFLPVTPGTKFVTIGGAVANDVHGKNHHQDGSFGHFVTQFELLRSDGERRVCSPSENTELFHATIGGLGLTGLLTWVEIQLKPIKSSYVDVETLAFHGIDEFLSLSDESREGFLYTVAWLDCLGAGDNFARGIFYRGNHSDQSGPFINKSKRSVPVDFPGFVLQSTSVKMFNELYFRKEKRKVGPSGHVHYDPFFYPLDGISDWNKIYGRKGFLQYQCVVSRDHADALGEVLKAISKAGAGSFLAVLKEFGNAPSVGMMSFPRPGLTLALDFPIKGEKTFSLLRRLDDIVIQTGGAVYPAKDARMSRALFLQANPNIEEFKANMDPKFMSDFWRRLGEAE